MPKKKQKCKGLDFCKMEKEVAENLQLLGTLGIVREALNILLHSSRSKLLWAFVLTLLLPLSFAILGQNFILGPIFLEFQEKQVEAALQPSETTWGEWASEWRKLMGVLAADIAVVLALSMVSMAAVVYMVASIYTTNTKEFKLSYVRVLSNDVPRVWKRLLLTFLWFLVISLGFMMVSSMLAISVYLMLFFPGIPYPSVGVDAKNKLKDRFLYFKILPIVLVACSQIYITVVWQLASVVSVLEDKYYGLAAVVKSSDLIKGKRITALALFIFFLMFYAITVWLFFYVVGDGRSHGMGIKARAVNGALLLGLLCFVNVMWMLAQSVFYFVCKSYHYESIDDDSSFKVHKVGDYEALKTSSI